MILVIGSINMDVSFRVDELPQPGETVLATAMKKSPGGKGANQAVAASKLGGHVTMLGCLSDDEDSRSLLKSMKTAGVDISHIRIVEGRSAPTAFICVSARGENNIVVNPATNNLVTPEYIHEYEGLFEKATYCVLQMEIPYETVKEAIALCKKYGVKIVFNPSPIGGVSTELLYHVQLVVPNENEAAVLLGCKSYSEVTENALQKFVQAFDIGCMVITLGGKGCICVQPDRPIRRFPTIPREAVDTTGAGDTFLGALVTRLAENVSLEQAISFANTASGIEVMRKGAQNAMPTRKEVEDEYKKSLG